MEYHYHITFTSSSSSLDYIWSAVAVTLFPIDDALAYGDLVEYMVDRYNCPTVNIIGITKLGEKEYTGRFEDKIQIGNNTLFRN